MRITGQIPLGSSGHTQRSSSGTGTDVFRVDVGAPEPQHTAGVTGRLGLTSLQGLMSLQEESEPARVKRHRAARRGFVLIDALAALKAGLLAGSVDTRALLTLQTSLTEAQNSEQDPELREVFNAIDTRAAVELAKLGR